MLLRYWRVAVGGLLRWQWAKGLLLRALVAMAGLLGCWLWLMVIAIAAAGRGDIGAGGNEARRMGDGRGKGGDKVYKKYIESI